METQPQHFLFDTNIFIEYVSKGQDDHYIDQFLTWIEEDSMRILAPDSLLDEWKDKREKTLEYIATSTQALDNVYGKKSGGTVSKHPLKLAESRAEYVDQLMAKSIFIKTPESVLTQTAKRALKRLAPFHGRKTKTINDAIIYFTALHYIKRKKLESFVFITRDHGDFGAPETKKDVLHPDLRDPSINVYYYNNLYTYFLQNRKDNDTSSREKDIPFQIILLKQGRKNILDHLCDVIRAYRKKIEFLPHSLLARLDPFRAANHEFSYSTLKGTTLMTNNKELFEFFKSVDVKRMKFKAGARLKNTKTNIEKLDYVVTALNQNLVFKVTYIRGIESINIEKVSPENCQCAYCTYELLDYNHTLKALDTEPNLLKKAFVLFQLGKFTQSLRAYYVLYEEATQHNNLAAAYRLLLILHWVLHHAELESDDANDKDIFDTVKADSHEKLFMNVLNGDILDREIAILLRSSTILDRYKLSIKEAKDKIRAHYYLQLSGGHSSNGHFATLFYNFVNFIRFTVSNGMAYTKYSDFDATCDDYIEGVFLSISLNEYQESRITQLDDNLLAQLLHYGKAEKMIKHFTRYVGISISYASENKEFEQIVLNFLKNDDSVLNRFTGSEHFEESTAFYRIFWNLVLLLAVVDFDESFTISCFSKLTRFLKKIPPREEQQVYHIASVIYSKARVLGKKHLIPFFKFVLKQPQLHSDAVFDSFGEGQDLGIRLPLTDEEIGNLKQMTLRRCAKCDKFHHDALISIYPLLSKQHQKVLSTGIVQLLDANFNKELYYNAVIAGVIDHQKYLEPLLSHFSVKAKSPIRFAGSDMEITSWELNHLLNIVFMCKIKLPSNFIEKFKGISDYYDWLLDMERFDYKKFKPLWVTMYATKYYLERAFSFTEVKVAIQSYLKQQPQPALARLYSQYVH